MVSLSQPQMLLLLVLATLLHTINGLPETYSSCMTAYNSGGAPAVLDSTLNCASHFMVDFFKKSTHDCEFASVQGYRKYQEDRVSCNLDLRLPLFAFQIGASKRPLPKKHYIAGLKAESAPKSYIAKHNFFLPTAGKDVKNEAKVNLLAVFDGHGGSEASEMAKHHLLDYFLVHVIAGAFKKASNINNQHDLTTPVECSHGCLPQMKKESLHELLKEALVGAIHDIDQKFSLEVVEKRYSAGSTASVVLLLHDEELMVANVGDSKVILCAEYAEELTSDHHPDRDDERARIESVGGYVLDWDIPRVNGILAVSRAIGDVSLKRYGVIAEPEMVGWRNITVKDRYLVVASDGIFESLTPENVCQLIEDANVQENGTPYDKVPFLPSYSLAQYIVKTALEMGTTDNLSAIVVPLAQAARETIVHKDEL